MKRKYFFLALNVIKQDILREIGLLFKRCVNAPYLITIHLTSQCNARCITCNYWTNKADPNELSIDELKDLILSLRRWTKTASLVFTGGEPFCKEHLLELLEYSDQLGFFTTVCTNGVGLTPGVCDKLIESGIGQIIFSVNSLSPEVHDYYKGIKGNYANIVSCVKYIKSKNKKIQIRFMHIVSKDNYQNLADFADWAYTLGVDTINFQPIRDNFGPIIEESVGTSASVSNSLWKIDDLTTLDNQIDLLIAQRKKGLPIVIPERDLQNLKLYFRDPQSVLLPSICKIGFRSLFILPEGGVKLCYYLPTVGTIRKDTIKEIWFSDEAQKQRRQILVCKKPCVASCGRNFNLWEKITLFLTYLRTK